MKSLCLVKEARHKRPHLYVFSLILRTQNTQAKHRYRKHSNDFPATMRETGGRQESLRVTSHGLRVSFWD